MQFLISVVDDRANSATESEYAAIHAFNRKLDAGGHRVLAVGLAAPSEAKVVDGRGVAPVITDGPFAETKEFAAGLWIFEAADLDQALDLAVEGSRACNRRLEVRAML
jgi:hypothetical protein